MDAAAEGTFIAEFDRTASGFPAAVVFALEAMRSALPHAQLLRVQPSADGEHGAFAAALNRALDLAARVNDLRPDELEAVRNFVPAEFKLA